MSRLIRSAALLLALAPLAAATACGTFAGQDSATTSGDGSDGLAAGRSPFWVDPASPAARQMRTWKESGREKDAEAMRRIAEQPVALWPSAENVDADIAPAVRGAAEQGRTAVFVAYNIPHRDCGQHSAGGAKDGDGYLRWISSFAQSLGDSKALVILEPDAVGHNVDGCTPPQYHEERYRLLGAAIDRLKAQPHTEVYLDAGNPAWIKNPAKLAEPLAKAGIARADGFALNVSNFQSDAANRDYGRRLSRMTGGKHFVIDSSRNGRGPLTGARANPWCNPPGRSLGKTPTTDTGDALVDAYLWVKRPGESDGACRGGPAAGTWWPEYALGLASG